MFGDFNHRGKENRMQLKVILNRIQKQPGFVYGAIRLYEKGDRLVLDIEIGPETMERRCVRGAVADDRAMTVCLSVDSSLFPFGGSWFSSFMPFGGSIVRFAG